MSSVLSSDAIKGVAFGPLAGAWGIPARASLLCALATLAVAPCWAQAETVERRATALTDTQTAYGAVQVDTADLAIPSAQEVIVDLPSAFYTARHQRGEINGLSYVLFPDGSGKVMRTDSRSEALFRFECKRGDSCIITNNAKAITVVPAVGAPKPTVPSTPAGKELARFLAEWVLAGSGEPPEEALPQTDELQVAEAETTATNPKNVANPVPAKTTKAEATVADVAPPVATQPKPASTSPAQPKQEQTPTPEPIARAQPKPAETARPSAPTPKPAATAPAFRPASQTPVPRKAARTPPAPVAAPAPEPEETFFQRIKLNCSITGSVTLRYRHHSSGFTKFGKQRASFGCGARLTEKLSLRLSGIAYGNRNDKSPSDADFTYALTYRATEKITLSYSNYSARFGGSTSTFTDSLTSGTLRASYRLPKIKLPNDKTIGCSASVGLPKPNDKTINLTCSHALTKKLRISGTAYAYFSGQQKSYDPDFAYSASYRINDDWTLLYSNYANNRFFWNKNDSPRQGILGGTLSLSYKFKF